jgi:hypothetical protein
MMRAGGAGNTVLDHSAKTLFITELVRGMSLLLKVMLEPKVTVRRPPSPALHQHRVCLTHRASRLCLSRTHAISRS